MFNPKPSNHNPECSNLYTKPAIHNTQHASCNTYPGCCYAVDLGVIDYEAAWKLQGDLVSARISQTIDTDIILLLEHSPVFTLGRRGGLDHLLVSEEFLQKAAIPIVPVERGGDITYHGPGQIVVYLILNLETRRMGVVGFVEALEEVMLRSVHSWGIAAQRNPANRGIWVGNNKLGSIGIAIRKGISFHGLALNVNIDLTPFTWIQPCGLQGVSMTSMKQELAHQLPMDEVCRAVQENLKSVLGLDLRPKSFADLQRQLKKPT